MPGFFQRKNKYAYMKNRISNPRFLTSHNCLNSKNLYPMLPEFLQASFFDPGPESCGIRIVRYYLKEKQMVVMWCSVIRFGNSIMEINENMDSSFASIIGYLKDCHHIFIEHQIMMSEINYQCHAAVIYYLTNKICQYGMRPMLIEVDVQLKTVFLGGPKTIKDNNSDEMKKWFHQKQLLKNPNAQWPENGTIPIKEWTKMKSREFSLQRCDFVTYHILENSIAKGNEDLSDTVCYEVAYLGYLIQRIDIYIPYSRELLN